MQEVSHFKCKFIDKKVIWQFAEEFRSKYWQENILPVDIESVVEKRLKLNIEPKHGLLGELDMDATGIFIPGFQYQIPPSGKTSYSMSQIENMVF